MSRSLMTGITGLRTHQQKLDVVANNLANMNTVGFKSQSAVFSDLMYNVARGASAASRRWTGSGRPAGTAESRPRIWSLYSV